MRWWPVKSNTENPAYISMHNFDKMQWMEKFYVYLTEPTQTMSEQQILKISVQLAKSLSKYIFSTAKITRFEKTSFKLMATEIVKIKLYYLIIRISWKTKPRFFFSEFLVKSYLNQTKLANGKENQDVLLRWLYVKGRLNYISITWVSHGCFL